MAKLVKKPTVDAFLMRVMEQAPKNARPTWPTGAMMSDVGSWKRLAEYMATMLLDESIVLRVSERWPDLGVEVKIHEARHE